VRQECVHASTATLSFYWSQLHRLGDFTDTAPIFLHWHLNLAGQQRTRPDPPQLHAGQLAVKRPSGRQPVVLVSLLLREGANLNARDSKGWTLLIYGVIYGAGVIDQGRDGCDRVSHRCGSGPRGKREYGESALNVATQHWRGMEPTPMVGAVRAH
jgi:hypothetical protein